MFERFTDRARKVVVLAQEEARFLSHNYIGTEHILLGMLSEGEGIGGTVLTRLGMTRDGVRAEVEEMIGRGKTQPSGHIPFTPRAKKTLELALREAIALRHAYIGTEHILLGLIREGDGVAAQIMRRHKDLLEIRTAVLDVVSSYSPGAAAEVGDPAAEEAEESNAVLRWLRNRLMGGRTVMAGPFRPGEHGTETAPRGTPAVEAALKQAAALAGHAPVGSHHLLLAALADTNSAASRALAQLGVNLDELREKLRSAPVTGTSDEKPEQAGRRQMSIQVSDEILTVTLTDPVIVAAGQEALRTVNAKTEPEPESESAEAGSEGAASATKTVIRGDHPAAGNLAQVWTELRKTLNDIASVTAPPPATTVTEQAKARVKAAREAEARFRAVAEAHAQAAAEEAAAQPSPTDEGDAAPDEGEAASS